MEEGRKIPAVFFHRQVRRRSREEVIFISSPILLPVVGWPTRLSDSKSVVFSRGWLAHKTIRL